MIKYLRKLSILKYSKNINKFYVKNKEHDFLYLQPNLQNEIPETLEECFSKISNIMNIFHKYKFKIILTDKSIQDTLDYICVFDSEIIDGLDSDTKGIFLPYQRLIISNFDSENIFHEIGHFIDFLPNINKKVFSKRRFYTSSNEFKDCYETDRTVLFSKYEYFKDSKEEFFAESFSIFINNNNYLKYLAPSTYDYFDKILGKIK